jgi:GNAT superfamily N-acetyltransferase
MSGRPRAAFVEALWLLVVLAIAAGIFLCRMEDSRRLASGDSYWYMRQAQIFAGVDPPTASDVAGRLICRDLNRSARDKGFTPGCTTYVTAGMAGRYKSIFDSRPGYPLFAAPLVGLFGAWRGMIAATMLLALLAAALAYLAVWMATGRRTAGVLGAGLLLLLPSGFFMTRLLTEGGCVAGIFATLIGVMLVWRGRWIGLAVMAAALAWLFAFRSATGMAMAVVVLVGAVIALLTGVPRRQVFVTGGFAAVVVGLWSGVSAIFRLPGLTDTIQDFATYHYQKPDVAHPIGWLVGKNLRYWPDQLSHVLTSPWSYAFLLFAVVVLVRRLGQVAWPWIGTGLIGVLMLIAHPAGSEYDRMMLTLWIPVACAFGYAGALMLDRPDRPGKPAAAITVPAQPGLGGDLRRTPDVMTTTLGGTD